MSYTTYLAHHGIKGQKWGVRRFQKADGSLTDAGKQRSRLRRRIISRDKTNPEINDLVRAMPDEDKARIGLDKGQEYTNHDESVNIAHRSVLRRGKKIVAFCDAFMAEADLGQYGKNPLYVAIGTSAEQQNRGKGYATIVAKQMQKWFDSQDEFDVVVWSAKRDNVASRKIAEKLNFKYIPESASDTWVDYAYSKKREVSHSVIVNDDIYSYRSYLAHHGIKGQKWGIRRFQNYDGTRIKKGSSSEISEGARLVRDISKKYNPVFKQTLFEKLRNRTHIDKKAEEQRDAAVSKIKELINDGDDDVALNLIKKYKGDLDGYEKEHSKFEALAGLAYSNHGHFSKDTSGMTDEEAKDLKDLDVSWYMFDDGDQGRFNSVDYYLVSKGKNPNEYAAKIDKDKDKAIDDIKAKVKKVLGEPEEHEDREAYNEVLDSVSKTLFYEAEDSMSFGTYWPTLAYNVAGEHSKYSDDEIKMMKDDITKYSKEATEYARKWDSDFGHSDLPISTQLTVVPSYTTYLAHHGIKGQKWGVRRFQKADGSLTAAGAKRYGIKSTMSAGRKVGAGLVKAARGGIQKVKEAKARKAAEKLERQKKVWAKTRLGLTMNADKFTVEELREANNRLDERDRAARGLAEQVKRGVGYFQAIRDVTGAIKDTKDYIEDISGEKGKKAKAADELKYQRELEKEKRTYERDMVRDQLKANQEYEYKREKDKLDRESKEKIEKMKAKTKKKKESGGSDPEPEPDDAPKKKQSRENTTEFEDVYWNSSKKDREFVETVFPKEVDEAKERKKRRNKARREVDEAIRRMGFFGHSDISTYGAYLEHHGIKGQKWGIRRFQNEDGTLTKAGLRRNEKAEKFREKELKRYNKSIDRATQRGQKSTKQMYEKLADHLVKMTVDDIYKEHRAVRTQAIGKAVLAGVATTLASSVAGLPNIASIPIGVAMGKAASAGTRDKYRLEQIAHAVIFADDNALEHHGIKGQKWGVRRFQDEAGRLTSAGKKHVAELRDKVTSKLKINAKSIDFEPQGGGGGGTIDGWEDVSKEDEVTLNDQKASLVLFLDRGMMSEEEVKELAEAFGYEFDDSLPMDVHLRRLSEAVQKTSGSDLKEAMFNFQQIQRKKVSYSEGIANGVSAVANALFSSNLAAVADPVLFVKDVISAEKAKAAAEKRKRGEPVDEETGLHIKQNTDASREEDLKDVNPGWKNLATNTKHNCMCCTATYDMRRRGYDVTANEVQFGYDYGDVTRWYPDAKVERLDTVDLERKYVHKSSEESQKQYKQEVNEQLQKELVAQGDGARGNLMVTWDGGGGHSMAYEVVNGVAYVYDGQANMKLDTMNVVAIANNIQYARLDNVDFDPEKIKEVVH